MAAVQFNRWVSNMNRILSSLYIVAILACTSGCAHHSGAASHSFVSRDRAVEIARTACNGKLDIPVGVIPIVTEKDGAYIVTFPTPKEPVYPKGDYFAEVTVEKASGKVIEILSSD